MVTESLLNQFVSEAMGNIDIAIIIALMGVGFCIKHLKFFEKISNDLIPPVLIVASLLLTFMQNGINVQAVITSIVSSATAIGLHQQGKNIFNIVTPSTSSLAQHLMSYEEEESVEEDEFEDVDENIVE